MAQTKLITLKEEWQGAWQHRGFRNKVTVGMLVVIFITCIFPYYFQAVESRTGVLLNDPVLRIIPPHNVSVAIFIFIWAVSLLSILRAVQNPSMFLTFIWGWIFLTAMRAITIYLVPLEPPVGLIGLVDPLSNAFYGDKFVTRDLFFSGHTSTVFLLSLCIPGKLDKKLILVATIFVGILLLVQHVHYTLDVVVAPLGGWAAWLLARKVVKE